MKTVAVLGAGLQGACAALALREQGWRVLLVDQEPEPLQRASLRNEGKLHLGFIYANDASFRTARLMLESALRFAPLLDRWLPDAFDWPRLRSRAFTYLVMRDSLLDADALAAHYDRLADALRADRAAARHYAGHALDWLWRPATLPAFIDRKRVDVVAETEEVALDLVAFRAALCNALASIAGIGQRMRFRIDAVQRTSNGFRIDGRDPHGAQALHADAVVNCLWDGRLAIDRQLGIAPRRPWVHRLKYRVLARLPDALQELPALTLVLGPYGDVVPLGDASYLSWYPQCRRGWSVADAPPAEWDEPCRGRADPAIAADVAAETLRALDRIVPGIGRATVTGVDAGVVFSWGDSDVDEVGSEFHQRHAVGAHLHDGYCTVDTGKLTCAPLFGARVGALL